MKAYVLDTSALIRLYVPDGPLPDQVEQAISEAGRAEAVALVPELAWAEAAQVLHKKVAARAITAAEADEALTALLALPLESVGHREYVTAALEVARARGLSVYDALFLALAKRRRAVLVSADARLLRAWQACR